MIIDNKFYADGFSHAEGDVDCESKVRKDSKACKRAPHGIICNNQIKRCYKLEGQKNQLAQDKLTNAQLSNLDSDSPPSIASGVGDVGGDTNDNTILYVFGGIGGAIVIGIIGFVLYKKSQSTSASSITTT